MQLCEEAADGLAARGHEVVVLTSIQRDGPEVDRPYPVYRLLNIDPDWQAGESAAMQFFLDRRRRECSAITHLTHIFESFQPHVIFVWHAIGLPRMLLQVAEQMAPTVYYLAGYLPELPDEYIAYWRSQPKSRAARLFKHPLSSIALDILRREGKPVTLRYEHVICVSDYVRQRLARQNLIPSTAVTIYNGVDVEHFSSRRPMRDFDGKLALLYAGRLEADKGVHLIIQALGAILGLQRDRINHLSIVGDGEPDYIAHLHSLVSQYSLSDYVQFSQPVPRHNMPDLLDAHDILIQPSALEALSRIMQEAMVMGLLLIGTTTGGSGELLVHEETGLAFEAGDAASLASQLLKAIQNPGLARKLALAGEAQVRGRFSIDQTISKLETYLQSAAQQDQ